MCFDGIWIKAIAEIMLAIIAFLCAIYAYKKLSWNTSELSATILICLIIFVFGLNTISHAIKPNIQQITVNYSYQSKSGVVFGREYHFVDEKDNSYDLTMEPITTRKIFQNKDFNKKTKYIIKYEKKSNVIIYIEEATNTNVNQIS